MSRSPHLSLALLLAIVVLMRLPFLNQAVQGDDPYYLFGARHALIDPAHPSHARYVFQGDLVDMRGHPHPPLNSWILAGLLALFGEVREIPFHGFYILFSLIAAISMWFLAGRWGSCPLAATLLFIATPAFVINGNSFEADVPFLAFWLAGIAAFTAGRPLLATIPLMLAAVTAYQAVIATPILLVYCWLHARHSKVAWGVAFSPVLTVALYQMFERLSSGALPATVLAGYFSSYGLQQITNKLTNAAALTAHAGWLVFPLATLAAFRHRWPVAVIAGIGAAFVDPHPLFWVSFGTGALLIASGIRRRPDFLEAWILIFFAAALIVFFAGSARYLLPLAAPVAILVARNAPLFTKPAFAMSLILGLSLASVNYQHWDGYRRFVADNRSQIEQKRVWVNSEWGFRFYLEEVGALPLSRTQILQPAEWIASSVLGLPNQVAAPLGLVASQDVLPLLPLRLIGLGSKSGYSTASQGLRPFDISSGPVDRVRLEAVLERRPVLSWLPMSAPESGMQIINGMYPPEANGTRWMGKTAVILLKPPARPLPVAVQIYLHEKSPARQITLTLDGRELLRQALPASGMHTIATPPATGSTLTVTLDKTFSIAGDSRELGAIVIALGFR